MMKHWFSDLPAWKRDPLSFLCDTAANSTADFEQLALGPSNILLLCNPALVKPIMKESEEVVYKGRLVQKISAVLGQSSLTLAGDAHKRRRSILHERLARGMATTYVSQMTAVVRQVVSPLLKAGYFRADIVASSLALKLACVALFGHRVLNEADELAITRAFQIIEGDLQAGMFRFLPETPWKSRARTRRRDEALATVKFIIGKVKEAASETSVLKALKEAGLTDDEIRDEITTMIVAGFHTTGAAAAWITYFLSLNPLLLKELRAEYDSLAGDDGEIPGARLTEARVSAAFVKEVLRLYPSAWWMTRELRCDFDINGQKLAKGSTIIFSPWAFHRNPKYFVNPEEFSLDREYSGTSYIPFGVGPRACVGMGVAFLELQLIALELAVGFELSLKDTPQSMRPFPGITLSAPEFSLWISPRNEIGFSRSAAA